MITDDNLMDLTEVRVPQYDVKEIASELLAWRKLGRRMIEAEEHEPIGFLQSDALIILNQKDTVL